MTNWQNSFKKWLKETCHLSDKSLEHYSGAIKNILAWSDIDVMKISDRQSLQRFQELARKNPTFISRDSVGNNMYSAALNHFNAFLLNEISKDSILYPEILDTKILVEGAKKQITVNAYERNSAARKECIRYFGAICTVCGFDFRKTYGEDFEGVIHVHHVKPLSEITQEYVVDPIRDLIPVCPNCHLVIHSKPSGTYNIDEVKSFLKLKYNSV